jgi:AmmeMemoRadiSam system protein B
MDFPKLREIEAFPVDISGQRMIGLRDPLNFSSEVIAVPPHLYLTLVLMDGQHSIVDIQAAYMRSNGELIFRETIEDLLEKLDAALFLDNDRFRDTREAIEDEFRRADVRAATLAGKSYDSSPELLAGQIDEFFAHPDGPGPLDPTKTGTALKGIVAPHIDFLRGGPCFAWAYKELVEGTDADLFVLFGTAHAHTNGIFVVTDKDFDTPFGRVRCEREIVRAIEERVVADLRVDEFVHRGEHSLEFQTVFLSYLFRNKRDISIVPILCGSFHSLLAADSSPMQDPHMQEFVAAVREALAGSGKKVCYVAGADLAHVGPRFGDRQPVDDGALRLLKADDLKMLETLEQADAEAFFSNIRADMDRRKICGLPPIYTMLQVMEASSGKLFKYHYWHDPDGTVTFASIGFY